MDSSATRTQERTTPKGITLTGINRSLCKDFTRSQTRKSHLKIQDRVTSGRRNRPGEGRGSPPLHHEKRATRAIIVEPGTPSTLHIRWTGPEPAAGIIAA